MRPLTVALFAESERGSYKTAYLVRSLSQLADCAGNPPLHSKGMVFAVQALLYHCNLLFFRVAEEGFSLDDYYYGMELLKDQREISDIAALCIPGVGDHSIIEATAPICERYHSILIITAQDFQDLCLS